MAGRKQPTTPTGHACLRPSLPQAGGGSGGGGGTVPRYTPLRDVGFRRRRLEVLAAQLAGDQAGR